MRRESEFEQSMQIVRVRLWKSMLEDFELSWLKDAPASAAARVIQLTLKKMSENRANEESWRIFFGERIEI